MSILQPAWLEEDMEAVWNCSLRMAEIWEEVMSREAEFFYLSARGQEQLAAANPN